MCSLIATHALRRVNGLQSIISFGASKLAPAAGDILDGLCLQYTKSSELLIKHAGHRMTGQVLVEAVQGALPRHNAITVSPCPQPHSLDMENPGAAFHTSSPHAKYLQYVLCVHLDRIITGSTTQMLPEYEQCCLYKMWWLLEPSCYC